MTWKKMLCFITLVGGLLLSETFSYADKLDDLGLDRNGKPIIQKVDLEIPSTGILLPGRYGMSTVSRAATKTEQELNTKSRVKQVSEWVIAGPSKAELAEGFMQAFTRGTGLDEVVESEKGRYEVRVQMPESFLSDPEQVETAYELIHRSLQESIYNQIPEAQSVILLVLDPEDQTYKTLDSFLPPDSYESVAPEPDSATLEKAPSDQTSAGLRNQPIKTTSGRPQGGLSGKAVYLNPGHGYVYRPLSESWGVQRGFVHNNIEDFSNVDTVNQYVYAYCYNAGADVFSVREVDMNTNMVVVDNDDGAPDYVETGSGWTNSSLAGFANGQVPYVDGENPFSFGTNRLITCAVGTPTATASWIPTIPATGWYNVYVSHGAFSNRSPQAHYRVYHAGGETDYYIDQRRRRFTWIFIGAYYFDVGRNPDSGKVVLYNDSTSADHYISADAVRFGGGIGVIQRGSAGLSGKPRYDEDARYHLQFSGAPSSVYNPSTSTDNQMDERDGWSGRPRFGRWLKEAAETYSAPSQDSVYISSHTNAGGGTGMGTFIYTGQAGSWHDTFRNYVHDEVLSDLSNGYSTNFHNHGSGKKEGTYGENNPSNVGNLMPIFLGEWLFHDSASDMAMYHDPKFRQTMGRAIYQGIVKFWANRNGTAVHLLPEPPRNFYCVSSGSTSVQLRWTAPQTDSQGIRGDAATGYNLYQGTHGKAFPAGEALGNVTTYTVNGLTPGKTYYFKLTATNPGGESFPTEVLAVRTKQSPSDPKVLLVSGFDKLDRSTRIIDQYSGSPLYRQNVLRMNTFDYIVEHARAIEKYAGNVAFDSCEDDAVGSLDLANYDAVVWIGGIQAEVSTDDPTVDTSLTTAQRSQLQTYLAGGGSLFISGSEIAWDLDRDGGTSFVDTSLKATYVADDAGRLSAQGEAGSIFSSLEAFSFGDESNGTYPVLWPDVIEANGGSLAALAYTQGAGGGTYIDDFETLSGWKDPNYSGQTSADAASTFTLTSSIKHEGSFAADLYYVWGDGSFIREYNSGLPEFPAASTFSAWVYGDNSGHQVRICLRDSDSDLFVNDYLTLDFTGWREISWDLQKDTLNVWVQSGNGTLDGPNVRLDSIQVNKVSSVDSGHIYFDEIAYLTEGSSSGTDQVAAIQYAGDYRLVYLGFPFETISDADVQADLMSAALDFLVVNQNAQPAYLSTY